MAEKLNEFSFMFSVNSVGVSLLTPSTYEVCRRCKDKFPSEKAPSCSTVSLKYKVDRVIYSLKVADYLAKLWLGDAVDFMLNISLQFFKGGFVCTLNFVNNSMNPGMTCSIFARKFVFASSYFECTLSTCRNDKQKNFD